MNILAISGSGRINRMTHQSIKALLKGCKDEVEIISLAGKQISGCIGCAVCAKDNVCKVKDDWNEIGEKMKLADIIIFGAPNYFGMVNALSHATMERTFCFRHRGANVLQGKLGVVLTTCETRENEDHVQLYLEKMFGYCKMDVIAKMHVQQYNQCYTCGFGHSCLQGSVVRKHGVLEEILECHLPKEVSFQEETQKEILQVRKILKAHGVSFNE